MAASPRKRWERVLDGCPLAVVIHFSERLLAEGLDPDDPASLAELSPQLLDSMGLEDEAARDRLLALVNNEGQLMQKGELKCDAPRRWLRSRPSPLRCAPSAQERLHVSDSSSTLGRRKDSPRIDSPRSPKSARFERRVFDDTDRRGVQAQEIVPGVFLGGFAAAMNVEQLRKFGITHIVNATSRPLKATPGIKVMCLHLKDADGEQDISCHFLPVIAFIEEALAGGGGVLVHCVRGVSRSSTLVCAYLIAHNGLGVLDSLAYVQQARPVAKPRPGFVRQLKGFKEQLVKGSESRVDRAMVAAVASPASAKVPKRWRSPKAAAKR